MSGRFWLTTCLIVIFLTVAASGFAQEQEAAKEDAYIIGPGDVIEISVWKDESLTKVLQVIPDGTISFPLIGRLAAGGRTMEELKQELVERLSEFVPDPVVSVSLQQVNSLVIYILGKVNGPGRYQLNSRISVLQALAIAGGLNPFAKKNKIRIFRKIDDSTQIINFNYDDVASGKHAEQNVYLERGDVVVVP